MTPLKTLLLLLLAPCVLVSQVAGAVHQHRHLHEHRHANVIEEPLEEHNSTLESRYVLSYPYNPRSAPKRGLPFNNPSKYIQTFKGAGSKITWAYNWDSYMDPGFPKNIEFIPMLWGDGADHTTNWVKNVNNAISRGSRHIVAFNEPDGCVGGGACMSPRRAVNAYKKYVQPFKGRVYLGAPAVTNGPAGLPWLKEFFRLCTGCHFDFLPVHWYDSATNDGWFKLYMSQAYAASGKLKLKLWVTEFNGAGTMAQKTAFLRRMMQWMDSQSYIVRYSWFWCDPNSTMGPLVDGRGDPSALGRIYTYS